MSNGVTPINEQKMLKDMSEADKHGYIMRCLIAFDVLCNVVFLRGHQDETISSHASRAAALGHKWGIALIWALNLVDHNHGPNAQAGDVASAEAVIQTEEQSGNIPNDIKISNT